MMEFTYNGLVRWGFGFHNPNHAAAAICAILPFLWGWRRLAWMGRVLSAALIAALALTYSRTGFLVAAMEAIVWAMFDRAAGRQAAGWRAGGSSPHLLLALLASAAIVGGVASRFSPDASLMNRPAIWWAGMKLAAANPLGVGHGHSGLLVSTFMLDGIEVRTLVNSHLTLLAEQGWLVGGAWAAFLALALAGGWRRHPRLWIAFAGLTVSAFASSVFDWHVLFGFEGHDGPGGRNFTLSWMLFADYLAMGTGMVFANGGVFTSGRTSISAWKRRLSVLVVVALGLMALRHAIPVMDAPVVRKGLLVKFGREMPLVLHDEEWTLKAVLPYLKDGYLLSLAPGYVEPVTPPKFVWLFGAVAESAHRFPGARIVVVDPPEFCPLPPNAKCP